MISAAAALICTPAPAQAPIPPAEVAAPGRWTAQQIHQAFVAADTDNDGVLSRAEAQRLSIIPRSFEEMDVDKDGTLTFAEYQGAFATSADGALFCVNPC